MSLLISGNPGDHFWFVQGALQGSLSGSQFRNAIRIQYSFSGDVSLSGSQTTTEAALRIVEYLGRLEIMRGCCPETCKKNASPNAVQWRISP